MYGKAYTLMCAALEPYLKPEILVMLYHPHTTQSNEALNKSVSSYGPKHKMYFLTKSLEARVGVAASVQIGGYEKFWRHTYHHFELHFHNSLSTALIKMDQDKNKKGNMPQQRREKERVGVKA